MLHKVSHSYQCYSPTLLRASFPPSGGWCFPRPHAEQPFGAVWAAGPCIPCPFIPLTTSSTPRFCCVTTWRKRSRCVRDEKGWTQSWGKKRFSSTVSGSKNWTDKDRVTGEKYIHFIKVLHIHGSLHKKTKTPTSDQSRKYLYLLDKETMNLWRINKARGVWARGSEWWSNKVCFHSLLWPKSCLLLLVQRGDISHGRLISYFQRRVSGEARVIFVHLLFSQTPSA